MIDRAQIEARVKELTEQRELQRRRLTDYQAAVRATEQACQQLEGALIVLQDVLAHDGKEEDAPCPPSPPGNNDSSAQS